MMMMQCNWTCVERSSARGVIMEEDGNSFHTASVAMLLFASDKAPVFPLFRSYLGINGELWSEIVPFDKGSGIYSPTKFQPTIDRILRDMTKYCSK